MFRISKINLYIFNRKNKNKISLDASCQDETNYVFYFIKKSKFTQINSKSLIFALFFHQIIDLILFK